MPRLVETIAIANGDQFQLIDYDDRLWIHHHRDTQFVVWSSQGRATESEINALLLAVSAFPIGEEGRRYADLYFDGWDTWPFMPMQLTPYLWHQLESDMARCPVRKFRAGRIISSRDDQG